MVAPEASPLLCYGRVTRRELLRAGSLSALGLTTSDLARLRAAPPADAQSSRRRRNSCVFFFLFGGPSHIDLWDMKPAAPSGVSGESPPAATRGPGIQLCAPLPLLACLPDMVCLLRSMKHVVIANSPACRE